MSKSAETSPLAQDTDAPDILVVDLDGTLIQSDMLLETFWSSFASHWQTPFLAAAALMQGRAKLKETLAQHATIDIARLPYNQDALAYIRDWRSRGGKVALVTASDQHLADRISDHLGLFDQAHGSDGETNLKGARKAAFLTEHFAGEPFAYMGDAYADLPVWGAATKAITVNASAALRKRVDGLNRKSEHLGRPPARAALYLKALRPHQWLKNTLIFLPMLVGQDFTAQAFSQSFMAFVSFCLVASSVYLLNDLLDLEADRAHPRKRNRPFASGSVPLAHGSWLAPLLFGLGMVPAVILGGEFTLVVLGYYAATTAYSLVLKRQTIIDICTLAGLYTMRIWAGAAATVTPLSAWLLAFSIFFFLSLAAIKRQAELVDSIAAGQLQASGRGYHVGDLPLIVGMATASGYVSVLVLALYLNSPAVLELFWSPKILLGICLVLLYWISRIIMVTHRGEMLDDPLIYAVKDRVSQFCLLLIFGFAIAGKLA